jgi:type VI secretion system secreted protein Hcp
MMNHIIRRYFGTALFAVCLVSSQATHAAFDAFLKIEGIPGESRDSSHKEEIDVLSWSWGASNTGTHAGGGGGGAGKVSMNDLTVTKALDKSSPRLMLACAKGDLVRQAVLVCRSQEAEPVEYLKITLSDILVSSYSTSGSAGGDDRPMESISFNFGRIEIEYIPVDVNGVPEEPVRAAWDVVENTAE